MGTIPLPWKQEADQYHVYYYNGTALGGWLTGTADGGPKPLSGLDLEFTSPPSFGRCADAC